jgi:GAF domain-containing protein
MECRECVRVFEDIGAALNAPTETEELLAGIAQRLVERFHVAGCLIRLLSRDRRTLEELASYGLSERFLAKGPVDPERSVREALEGRLVVIADCRTDPRIQYPAAHAEEGFVTVINVPLATRGQVVGVMRLYAREARSFAEQELEVLQVVASFCASAIVHAMFHKVLRHINRTVRSSLDLGTRLDSMVRLIAEDLRVKGCFIQLMEASGALSKRCFSTGLSEPFLAKATDHSAAVLSDVLAGTAVAVLQASEDRRIGFGQEASAEGVSSMLYLPMMLGSKVMGVIVLCTHRPYELSKDELSLLKSIADECALAVQNALTFTGMKRQYDDLVDDFRRWVDQSGGFFPVQPPS